MKIKEEISVSLSNRASQTKVNTNPQANDKNISRQSLIKDMSPRLT
jgi:hypothetical protein